MNKSIYLLFFFAYFLTSAQVKVNKNVINALLDSAESKSQKLQYLESISISKKALSYSEQIFFKEGIVKSNFWIAAGLCNTANYQDSFIYIENIEKKYSDYLNNNADLHWELQDLVGRNYLALGFKKQAIETFKKNLLLGESLGSSSKKAIAYIQLSNCFDKKSQDSIYYYLKKVKVELNDKNDAKNSFILYSNLAEFHFKYTQELDSAHYYNNIAIQLGKTRYDKFLYEAYNQKAEILYKQKSFEESLKYCYISLAIVRKLKRIHNEINLYKLISDNYKNLGNSKKELYYLNKNINLKDSLENTNKDGIKISTDRIISSDAERNKNILQKYSLLFIFILILILGISIIMVRKIKIKKRQKLNQKEVEIRKLQDNKQSEAKNELIDLAKKNAPEFSLKFKEVYPELYAKLIYLQPNLKNSELIFCAYLKLNFKTKEIATFTAVTPRAIEIRKNRFRKKFNISSEQDLNIWINNLI